MGACSPRQDLRALAGGAGASPPLINIQFCVFWQRLVFLDIFCSPHTPQRKDTVESKGYRGVVRVSSRVEIEEKHSDRNSDVKTKTAANTLPYHLQNIHRNPSLSITRTTSSYWCVQCGERAEAPVLAC